MDDSKQSDLEMPADPTQSAQHLFGQADQNQDQEGLDSLQVVLDQINRMRVDLDADPTQTGGIPTLRKKLALTDQYLAETLDMVNAARVRSQAKKNRWRAMQVGLKLATDLLLSSDPDVRNGRNVADRNAIATIKLQSQHLQLRSADQEKLNAEMILKLLDDKLGQLKEIRKHLRSQLKDLSETAPVGQVPRFSIPITRVCLPPAAGDFSSVRDSDPAVLIEEDLH